MLIEVSGENIQLLPEKAIWMPGRKMLFIADPHFGKINHFRRSGIVVPPKANDQNAELLISLVRQFSPERLIFLGDLFHSHYNEEWEVVGQISRHFNHISFELVRGNHDIMSALQYQRHHMLVHESTLQVGTILFSHEQLADHKGPLYNIAGHVHPAVSLMGAGRQSLTLPCFYFGKNYGLLPAFGAFTGLAKIKPTASDRVYVIADGKIMAT